MNTEKIANTKIGKAFIKIMACVMESRLRYRFFSPMKILQGVEIQSGQTVLEIGCGTGYFTIPTAKFLGE
jgi:protein-L-isoaspartate O-methyltransferase